MRLSQSSRQTHFKFWVSLENNFRFFLQWNGLKITNRALPCGLISNILVHSEVRAVFELRGDPMETLQVELSTNPSHVTTIKDKTLLECSNDNEAFI